MTKHNDCHGPGENVVTIYGANVIEKEIGVVDDKIAATNQIHMEDTDDANQTLTKTYTPGLVPKINN